MSHHLPPMTDAPPLAYTYAHSSTEATTGYFSCEPVKALSQEALLETLEACPMDEFLHTFALRRLSALPLPSLQALAAEAGTAPPFARPVLAALLLECALLYTEYAPLQDAFADLPAAALALKAFTPLVYLRWSALPDAPLHAAWSALFAANISQHTALPHPDDKDLPLLYADSSQGPQAPGGPDISQAPQAPRGPDISQGPDAAGGPESALAELHAALGAAPGPAWQRPPAQQTAARALELLVEHGIIAGVEMRHEASLSPIALLRKWQVDIRVQNGGLDYRLSGQATTYGRGLSLADARASYAMEMVERASAYASVAPHQESAPAEAGLLSPEDLRHGLQAAGQIVGTARPQPLIRASYAQLCAAGRAALDPNTLPLEVPFPDAPLHWICAQAAGTKTDIWVPAQAVYLFCNLDEAALWISPGSTGLASGNTLDEAKQAALTEIFERDAEATSPFDRRRCFRLRSRDARLQSLLDDYAARGIHVIFQDITTELGLPCYQCFVRAFKGDLARATGAHLHGPRAALAALTEVPYPYPGGAPSAPPLRNMEERVLEDLPSYSLESPARNVALLEALLLLHGLRPLYVELTRKDLEFPVLRALVPGLELTADFDRFSRIRPRLWHKYLRMFPGYSGPWGRTKP